MAEYIRNRHKTFVNPYNFVRLSNPKRSREQTKGDNLTGVIHCKMILRTPLAIPDTEHARKNFKGHISYPFMKIDGKPAVPGSSIRGPIRSMYEVLTSSCFVTMPDDYFLTQRVMARNPFSAGILRKEGKEWKLYKAERLSLGKKASPQKGEQTVKIGKMELHYGDAVKAIEKGYRADVTAKASDVTSARYFMFIGEPIFRKRTESVFRRDCLVRNISNDQIKKAMAGLQSSLQIYRNAAINKNLSKDHCGYKGFERAYKNGVLPIWYKINNGQLYLSLAAIGRKAFATSVNELANNSYNSCKTREHACPACRLFGMAKDEASVGKIRFTDARMIEGKLNKKVDLKELGSPRPGYLPFYSQNGMDYDSTGATIAGRKFYWHHPEAANSDKPYKDNGKQTERNATMDLVDTGAVFKFDVYFNNTIRYELDELLWVLCLGENNDKSKMLHKMGHGKPLGLGSVKIIVDGVESRYIDDDYRIEKIPVNIEDIPKRFSEKELSQILCATKFDYINEKICYPYVELGHQYHKCDKNNLKDNILASHQWFTSNKGRNRNDPDPMKLNNPKQADQTLFVYEVTNLENRDFKKDKNSNTSTATSKQKQGTRKVTEYQIDQEYNGKITGYNRNKKRVFIELDNGGKANLYFKMCGAEEPDDLPNVMPKNKHVTVKYKGKIRRNGNEYDDWKLIK